MSREPKGTWIATCQCGRKTYLKNLRYVFGGGGQSGTCRSSHREDREPHVTTEAGWCGCGEPERVDALMLAYLSSANEDHILIAETDTDLLMAYVAADLDWTEHGGVVTGAWLTPDGQAALAVLAARASALTSDRTPTWTGVDQ